MSCSRMLSSLVCARYEDDGGGKAESGRRPTRPFLQRSDSRGRPRKGSYASRSVLPVLLTVQLYERASDAFLNSDRSFLLKSILSRLTSGLWPHLYAGGADLRWHGLERLETRAVQNTPDRRSGRQHSRLKKEQLDSFLLDPSTTFPSLKLRVQRTQSQ